ncbi:DNA polymerase subunit beta [Kitasatospora sp. NPDC002551]|uniref:FAD-dependent oxidoreductase n=1 Tax=Kitasatospora sp. NPDC002551 TaxID=3154539 RepID=UPI003332DB8B
MTNHRHPNAPIARAAGPRTEIPVPLQACGHWDVVIAGSGPGGLACARALTAHRPGLRVLLLEAGRAYRRRPCPVDKGFSCTGCAGICNVVSGFGGSMHYGDGAKLSLLPSGRRLIDHFGVTTAQDLCATAYTWLTEPLAAAPELLGQDLSDRAIQAFDANRLAIREYPVAVLGESALGRVIEGFHQHLAGRIALRHTTELTAAEPDGTRLLLTVRSGRIHDRITADHLVLATGRRGVTSTTALLRSLGVPTELPDISLGVRFEMAASLLAPIGEEHPDLKITQLDAGARKVKTFCFCGGTNGGRLKFTHYQGAFGDPVITLDGHETTERPAPVDGRDLAANFGLLCQSSGRGNALQARDSFLAAYRELASGRPFTQRLGAFLDRRDETADWTELAAALPFQPSVADLATGRVDLLFTDDEHASLTAGVRRLLASILDHAGHPATLTALADQVLVVGPELEFLWDKPAVDTTCRVPGLPVYVVGDSAGIAQGIVQAAMMGIAAGRDIATRQPGAVPTRSGAQAALRAGGRP